jgi:hypothetical protein
MVLISPPDKKFITRAQKYKDYFLANRVFRLKSEGFQSTVKDRIRIHEREMVENRAY